MSFNSYLRLMEEDLSKFEKIRTTRRSEPGVERVNMES